ncbi:hypothetical protein OV079_15270 [Nannocystis pusilla]|uniref:Uncharacterized protein n=1 Tax=Nannocystis pusilla TaxID=889268 RepID=A0A9X3EN98_9BACT|nr:hypothetical protein [Nannocystis pusilla]MCY1006890.1 hypothetical protein [Nannocystis pusilla]
MDVASLPSTSLVAHASSPLPRRNLLRAATSPTAPCVLFVALALGCGAPPTGVRPEPGTLVFTPAAERLELRLVNHGAAPVPLTRIRFDTRTPDWGAFSIENREYPREIAAGGAVSLRLRVDRDHFDRAGASRSGSARLLFAAGEAPQIVELRWEPPDLASDLRRTAIRTALALALVALAWISTRRTRLNWTTWLPVLAALALFPFGPGLCFDGVGSSLSAADVEQCAVGRGGASLSLIAVGEGWLVYLVALVFAGLGRLVDRAALARRLASRDLALAAAFAGPLLAFGTLDPRRLVGEQAAGLVGGAAIPPLGESSCNPSPLPWPSRPRPRRRQDGSSDSPSQRRSSPVSSAVVCPRRRSPAAATASCCSSAQSWRRRRSLRSCGSCSGCTRRPPARVRAALFFLERAAMPLAIANLLVTSAYALLR